MATTATACKQPLRHISQRTSKDLTVAQCAALAALPQAPSHFQLVEVVGNDDVSTKDQNIIKRTSNGTYIANDASKERRLTCLKLMLEQKYITQEQYDKAPNRTSEEDAQSLAYNGASTEADYFADYVIKEVINDLEEKKGWDYDRAWEKVYNGGLKIHSTMDSQAQKVIEKEFDNDANFPNAVINTDGNGNVINKYGQVVLYDYNDYFDEHGNFTFRTVEIVKRKDGSMLSVPTRDSTSTIQKSMEKPITVSSSRICTYQKTADPIPSQADTSIYHSSIRPRTKKAISLFLQTSLKTNSTKISLFLTMTVR